MSSPGFLQPAALTESLLPGTATRQPVGRVREIEMGGVGGEEKGGKQMVKESANSVFPYHAEWLVLACCLAFFFRGATASLLAIVCIFSCWPRIACGEPFPTRFAVALYSFFFYYYLCQ